MALEACRSGIYSQGPKQTRSIRDSFRDIPIAEFTFTQDESRPTMKIPRGRTAGEDEGYLIAMQAVIDGDLTKLKAALTLGIDPHAVYANATTLLNEAAAQGRPPIIEELLTQADPNVKDCDPYGPCAPLYWAATYSRLDAVSILLNAGAAIDSSARMSEWALTAVLSTRGSIEQDQFDCLGILLQADADINLRKFNGETLLEQAIQFERHDLIDILIDRGADIRGSLTTAAAYGGLDTLKLLIDRGARDELGDPALLSAVTSRKTDLVKELLQYIRTPYRTELQERINAISQAKEVGPLNALLRDCGFLIKPKVHKPFGEMVPTSGDNLTGYGARLVGFSDKDGQNISFIPQHKRKRIRSEFRDEQDYVALQTEPNLAPMVDRANFSFEASVSVMASHVTVGTEQSQSLQLDSETSQGTLPRLTERNLAAQLGSTARKRSYPTGSIASTEAFSEVVSPDQQMVDAEERQDAREEHKIPTDEDFDPGFWDDLPLSHLQQLLSVSG